MNDELAELYQELIMEHNRHPRHYGVLAPCTHQAAGFNPLCGDQIKLRLQIENDLIMALMFEGKGCAISIASASLLTEALEGKSLAEAHELFTLFHETLTGQPESSHHSARLGKLAALIGVQAFPSRVKCATLAWHTLEAALANKDTPVSTE